MTTATRRPHAGSGPLIDPQLASLLERQDQVAAAAGRRAVELIREWMLAQDRSWLAVDFTKTRPEPPFADDEGLAAAVRALPRRAFGSGLDPAGQLHRAAASAQRDPRPDARRPDPDAPEASA